MNPKIVASAKIIEDFIIEVRFVSGEIRTVDFRNLPLAGLFKKIKTNRDFFNTLYVKDGYLMWGDDLTLDSDFVFEHSDIKQKSIAFITKVENMKKA